MANSEEGRKLTEAHRKKQIVLGEQTERRVKALAKYVNEEDISGSWRWRLEVQRVTEDGFNRSRDYAATYVDEYSLAETGWSEDIRLPVYDRAKTDEAITVLGVAGIKAGIRSGSPYRQAVDKACSRLAAHCGQLALAGGRNLIDITVKYSGRAGGYRRVTDGKPCAFCAMLASRGPVYSEETAFFESHHHCGCSAEIVYGDWVPSDEEADWAAVYKAAAGMADDAGERRLAPVRKQFKERDTILWRMRRISPQMFRDGVPIKHGAYKKHVNRFYGITRKSSAADIALTVFGKPISQSAIANIKGLDCLPKGDPIMPSESYKLVNPSKDEVNCVRASIAMELNARGYHVVAAPGSAPCMKKFDTDISAIRQWRVGDRIPKRMHSYPGNPLSEQLSGLEIGARGIISGNWKDDFTGHTWFWENTESGVNYYDGQTGEKVGSFLYNGGINYRTVRAWRLDNAEPVGNVLWTILGER